jgi:hypothetical protein
MNDIEAIANSAELAEKFRQEQIEQAAMMRRVTEREEGLLNIPQAALLLDVSRERVRELMKLGILSRFEFFDGIYLSFREIKNRRDQEIKAGRPKRGLIQKVMTGLKAGALTDKHQLKQGGYAGPYVQAQEVRRRKKK